MRPLRISLVGLALVSTWILASAGCGDSAAPSASSGPAFGPHGGPTVEFPEEKVVVEIVGESAASLGKKEQTVIAAYFYGEGMKDASTAAPSNVEVAIRTPDSPEMIKLKLQPSAGKLPRDKHRLISSAGPYMIEPLTGEITATVGGTTATKPFLGGR